MFAADASYDDERDFVLRYNFREPKKYERKGWLRIQGCWKSWCPKGERGPVRKAFEIRDRKEAKKNSDTIDRIEVTWNSLKEVVNRNSLFQSSWSIVEKSFQFLKPSSCAASLSDHPSDFFTILQVKIKKSTRTYFVVGVQLHQALHRYMYVPDVQNHQFSCHTSSRRLYFLSWNDPSQAYKWAGMNARWSNRLLALKLLFSWSRRIIEKWLRDDDKSAWFATRSCLMRLQRTLVYYSLLLSR